MSLIQSQSYNHQTLQIHHWPQSHVNKRDNAIVNDSIFPDQKRSFSNSSKTTPLEHPQATINLSLCNKHQLVDGHDFLPLFRPHKHQTNQLAEVIPALRTANLEKENIGPEAMKRLRPFAAEVNDKVFVTYIYKYSASL